MNIVFKFCITVISVHYLFSAHESSVISQANSTKQSLDKGIASEDPMNDLSLLEECIKTQNFDPFFKRLINVITERSITFIDKISPIDGPFIDDTVPIGTSAVGEYALTKPENRSRNAFKEAFIKLLKNIETKDITETLPQKTNFLHVNKFIGETKDFFEKKIRAYILSFVKDDKSLFLEDNIAVGFLRFDALHTPPKDRSAEEFLRGLLEYIWLE